MIKTIGFVMAIVIMQRDVKLAKYNRTQLPSEQKKCYICKLSLKGCLVIIDDNGKTRHVWCKSDGLSPT